MDADDALGLHRKPLCHLAAVGPTRHVHPGLINRLVLRDGFDQGEKEPNVINIVVDAIKSQPPK